MVLLTTPCKSAPRMTMTNDKIHLYLWMGIKMLSVLYQGLVNLIMAAKNLNGAKNSQGRRQHQ